MIHCPARHITVSRPRRAGPAPVVPAPFRTARRARRLIQLDASDLARVPDQGWAAPKGRAGPVPGAAWVRGLWPVVCTQRVSQVVLHGPPTRSLHKLQPFELNMNLGQTQI